MLGATDALRVYIGYDPRQPVAYQVVAHSVWTRASKPVSITRLQLNQLPITRRGLTEFTYSRFLAPWLAGYTGQSLFLDADILVSGDVYDLVAAAYLEQVEAKREPAVWVVKNPRRFEWPSMMLFNNSLCTALTPEWVEDPKNNPYDMALWANEIGGLPSEWNHIVGYDAPRPDAKLVHYTAGIPCWPETKDCEYAAEWRKEAAATISTVSFEALMGKSIHKGQNAAIHAA